MIGTMVTLASASTAEVLAHSDFDWLFIDMEHGALETRDVLAILQAVDHMVPCVVRVKAPEEMPIKTALDLGASGIIAPQINTAERAAAVVRYARYSPEGTRGVGLARAHTYGMRFKKYMKSANDRIAVIVQVEDIEAVENIEEIAAVEGIDAVFVGPYDLSASLGKTGKLEDAAVVAAISRVTDVCRKAAITLGFFGVTAEAVEPYIDRGYTLITAGVDTLFLASAAKQLRESLRD